MSLLVVIAASWAAGSLMLGLLVGRILRRLGRRYPAPRDAGHGRTHEPDRHDHELN